MVYAVDVMMDFNQRSKSAQMRSHFLYIFWQNSSYFQKAFFFGSATLSVKAMTRVECRGYVATAQITDLFIFHSATLN